MGQVMTMIETASSGRQDDEEDEDEDEVEPGGSARALIALRRSCVIWVMVMRLPVMLAPMMMRMIIPLIFPAFRMQALSRVQGRV